MAAHCGRRVTLGGLRGLCCSEHPRKYLNVSFLNFKNYFITVKKNLLLPPSKRIFPDSAPGPSAVNKKGTAMCLWQNLVAFEVQVHLRRQGLSSPSEGEGFTLPSEVDGENEDENEDDE